MARLRITSLTEGVNQIFSSGRFFLFRPVLPEVVEGVGFDLAAQREDLVVAGDVRNIPDFFSRSQTTLRRAPSTAPEPIGRLAARKRG